MGEKYGVRPSDLPDAPKTAQEDPPEEPLAKAGEDEELIEKFDPPKDQPVEEE